MAKIRADFKLSVTFLKEGKQFIAYSPALDLSTCGKTLEEARRRFAEASLLLLQELHRRGSTEEVLTGLGWKKGRESFTPPLVVGQEIHLVPARG